MLYTELQDEDPPHLDAAVAHLPRPERFLPGGDAHPAEVLPLG